MNREPTLLAVFAHPDDEAYGPGGTLAHYALSGAKVYLLTFTCGEAGSIGLSKTLAPDELCRRRRAELEGACEALGIAGHSVLGLPDRGLETVRKEEAVRAVLDEIHKRRPQVLLTFHHRGVSGHPDHIAVSRFVEEAFLAAGNEEPYKLYGWAIPRSMLALYRGEREVFAVEEDEIAAVLSIPDEAMERKIEAIRRHETQFEFYRKLCQWFGDYRKATSKEYFALTRRRLPRPDTIDSDLFAGVPGIG